MRRKFVLPSVPSETPLKIILLAERTCGDEGWEQLARRIQNGTVLNDLRFRRTGGCVYASKDVCAERQGAKVIGGENGRSEQQQRQWGRVSHDWYLRSCRKQWPNRKKGAMRGNPVAAVSLLILPKLSQQVAWHRSLVLSSTMGLSPIG